MAYHQHLRCSFWANLYPADQVPKKNPSLPYNTSQNSAYAKGIRSSPSPMMNFFVSIQCDDPQESIHRPVRQMGKQRYLLEQQKLIQVEDAIVQQMEWTFDALNLQHDTFLLEIMDANMWVPIQALLSFPRIKTMGVANTTFVAEVLRKRCKNVIVHPSLAYVRPSWARPLLVYTVRENFTMGLQNYSHPAMNGEAELKHFSPDDFNCNTVRMTCQGCALGKITNMKKNCKKSKRKHFSNTERLKRGTAGGGTRIKF